MIAGKGRVAVVAVCTNADERARRVGRPGAPGDSQQPLRKRVLPPGKHRCTEVEGKNSRGPSNCEPITLYTYLEPNMSLNDRVYLQSVQLPLGAALLGYGAERLAALSVKDSLLRQLDSNRGALQLSIRMTYGRLRRPGAST